VFGVCLAPPAQVVSLQKIQGQLQDRGALETIAHYLALLEEAFLVAPIPKFAATAARQRAAPPKLVPLSNALLAAGSEAPPSPAGRPATFGAWVENACLAHAWNAGQRVSYWREEPLEVDAVIDGEWGQWAVEVKTGPVREGDLRGLLEFCRRHRAYRPLLVADDQAGRLADAIGIAHTP
jgi:predicted AAA+ superfamily ATPase